MRMIDADVLLKHLTNCIETTKGLFRSVCVAIKCFVEQMPAVDAAPVVHGYWFLTEPEYLNCSVCGDSYYTGIETLSMALDHLEFAGGHKFCPNCGAKMDGERKDNDL